MFRIIKLLSLVVAVLISQSALAEYELCTLPTGKVIQCGGMGDRVNGYIVMHEIPNVRRDDTSLNDNVVSIEQHNSRQFTATYGDGRKSDIYVDRDGSVKKGIPPYSLP